MQTYGRLPRKPDPRGLTLQAERYLTQVTAPPVFLFDKGKAPFPILNQGQHGDCTIVSGATAQMRMERVEQKATLRPVGPDGEYPELLARYREIAQPNDGGAFLRDALDQHRKEGLPLGSGKRHANYRIGGYTELTDHSWGAICDTVFQFRLGQIGLMVTRRFEQIPIGVVDPLPGDQIAGGHALCVRGYYRDPTPTYLYGQRFMAHGLLVAATWGGFLYQVISPSFLEQYCDEIYGLIDANDLLGAAINRPALLDDIKQVTNA